MSSLITKPLGLICKVINGRAFKQEELLFEGRYRVLRVGNFFSNGSWYYSDLELEDDKYCLAGDLLFAWSASFGPRIWDGDKAIYHYHIWKLLEDTKIINRHFLYYYLLNSVKGMMASTHGSIMLHLTKDFMEKLPVRFPKDLELQRNISSTLLMIDKKIELNNRINTELEAMAKALYSYWFVQFDFPDANGRPYKKSGGEMTYNQVLGREIPKGWEVKKLDALVEQVKGNISPSEIDPSTPYIGLEHIPRKKLAIEEWATSDVASSDKTAFKKGDILFGKIRPYFHKVSITPFDGITSTDSIVLRPLEKRFYGLALETVFSDEFIELASRSATGSKMPRADWNLLKNYPVPLPRSGLLDDFQTLLDKSFEKINIAVMENKNLRELRDWLLPMLMNGQVTIK